ncbi:MAG: hypothetical protein RRY76_03560 [Clostridia bacterium]
MTNKQLMKTISDLAEDENISIDNYVLNLIKTKNDQIINQSKELPDEVRKQLITAIERKNDAKMLKNETDENSEMQNDIAVFKKNFPSVNPQEIPESVWKEVTDGISLSHAYALHLKSAHESEKKAQDVNIQNESRAIPVENDAESNLPFTKEDVEKMTPINVKSNYKKILNSIKNWKL